MFRMEIMCTKVSCCFVCSCIRWFICCPISHISFIVAVPVNQNSASPKKGSRLLFGHELSAVDDLSGIGSYWSSRNVIHIVGLYDL